MRNSAIITKLLTHPVLPLQRRKQLAKLAHEGDLSAKHELIVHSTKLAAKAASKYKANHADIDDLFQEACIGLCIAADQVDPRKGGYSTIAVNWARARVSRAISKSSSLVTIPSNKHELKSKIVTALTELRATGKYEPTLYELIAYMLERGKLAKYKRAKTQEEQIALWAGKIREMRICFSKQISLDDITGGDGELTVGGLIAHDRGKSAASAELSMDLMQSAKRARRLAGSDVQASILDYTFGLNGKPFCGVEDNSYIAKQVGCTLQHVQATQATAFAKIRKELGDEYYG